jgi:hypothetical protein
MGKNPRRGAAGCGLNPRAGGVDVTLMAMGAAVVLAGAVAVAVAVAGMAMVMGAAEVGSEELCANEAFSREEFAETMGMAVGEARMAGAGTEAGAKAVVEAPRGTSAGATSLMSVTSTLRATSPSGAGGAMQSSGAAGTSTPLVMVGVSSATASGGTGSAAGLLCDGLEAVV